MIQVNFSQVVNKAEKEKCKFAVIVSRYNGQWVFCRHKDRTTYECPGGHREVQEDILDTAPPCSSSFPRPSPPWKP